MVTLKVEQSTAGTGNYPVVDKGIYLAKVLEFKHDVSDKFFNEDGTGQESYSFKFEIVDDSGFNGQYVWGRTPVWFNTSPKCRLRKWAEEIMGVDNLPTGYELNSDVDFIGQYVQVWVQHTENGKAKVSDLLKASKEDVAKTAPSMSEVDAAVKKLEDRFEEEPF